MATMCVSVDRRTMWVCRRENLVWCVALYARSAQGRGERGGGSVTCAARGLDHAHSAVQPAACLCEALLANPLHGAFPKFFQAPSRKVGSAQVHLSREFTEQRGVGTGQRPDRQGQPIDRTARALHNALRQQRFEQQRRAEHLRLRAAEFAGLCQVLGQGRRVGGEGVLPDATTPSGIGRVEYQAPCTVAGFKVVAVSGCDHQAVTHTHLHAASLYLQRQSAIKSQQDLKVRVCVAAV
jgi:hypothetical protein